jgi:hypothetical protein
MFGTVHSCIGMLNKSRWAISILVFACPQADGQVFAGGEDVLIHQATQFLCQIGCPSQVRISEQQD